MHRQRELPFNTVSRHAYGNLKIPGSRDVVTITGKIELHLGAEEYSATLAIEAASRGFFNRTLIRQPNSRTPIKESELLHGMMARLDQGSTKHSGISWEGPHPAAQPLRGTQMFLAFSLQGRFRIGQNWRSGISLDAQGNP